MPHLHIKEFKEIKLPQKVDGISYDFIAKNIKKSDEVMISVSIDSEENATSFFLVLRINEDKILLKSDKLTRPASVYSVHKAMLSYAKLAQLEILSSNVPQKPKNIHLEELTALKTIEFFTTHFPTNKEINIEVGFGSGRHLIHQALQNPDILFVGIEIHRPSIEQVLKQISIQNIQNIYLLDYDARLFMELIPSNVVGKIFVHFPVPWDKKPHRRVISTSFIQEARRVLKVEGRLELRTDSENYYSYSYETFIAFYKTILHINKNRDIAISSKYEDRWKKMQKNIYDVTMINEESSKPLSIEGDFEFSPKRLNEQELISLNGSTQRFDGGFVHFERVYSLDDGIMFRISMGSFDRPEHLFVILKETSITYHPSLPLKSKSNLVAHKFLEGVF